MMIELTPEQQYQKFLLSPEGLKPANAITDKKAEKKTTRTVTLTFDDGSQHVYQNVPRSVTPEEVLQRAKKDFDKTVINIDGGDKKSEPTQQQLSQVPITEQPGLAKSMLQGAAAPLETAANFITSLPATVIGGVQGMGGTHMNTRKGMPFYEAYEKALPAAQKTQSALTYQPRTEQGQQLTENLGEALMYLPHKAGTAAYNLTGSPLAGSVAETTTAFGLPYALSKTPKVIPPIKNVVGQYPMGSQMELPGMRQPQNLVWPGQEYFPDIKSQIVDPLKAAGADLKSTMMAPVNAVKNAPLATMNAFSNLKERAAAKPEIPFGEPSISSSYQITPEYLADLVKNNVLTEFQAKIVEANNYQIPKKGQKLSAAAEAIVKGYKDKPVFTTLLDIAPMLVTGYPIPAASLLRGIKSGLPSALIPEAETKYEYQKPSRTTQDLEQNLENFNQGELNFNPPVSGNISIDPVTGNISNAAMPKPAVPKVQELFEVNQQNSALGGDKLAIKNTTINQLAEIIQRENRGLSKPDAKRLATKVFDSWQRDTELARRRAIIEEQQGQVQAPEEPVYKSPEQQIADATKISSLKPKEPRYQAEISSELERRIQENPELARYAKDYVVPEEQQYAIDDFINNKNRMTVAYGPPGTGKTELAGAWTAKNGIGYEFIPAKTMKTNEYQIVKDKLDVSHQPTLIVIDEADKLTAAQVQQVKQISEHTNARVLLTTNDYAKLNDVFKNDTVNKINLDTKLTPDQKTVFGLYRAQRGAMFGEPPQKIIEAAQQGESFRDITRNVPELTEQPDLSAAKKEPFMSLYGDDPGALVDTTQRVQKIITDLTKNKLPKNLLIFEPTVFKRDPKFAEKLNAIEQYTNPKDLINMLSNPQELSPIVRLKIETKTDAEMLSSLKSIIERNNKSQTPTNIIVEDYVGGLDPAIYSRGIRIRAEDIEPKPLVPSTEVK